MLVNTLIVPPRHDYPVHIVLHHEEIVAIYEIRASDGDTFTGFTYHVKKPVLAEIEGEVAKYSSNKEYGQEDSAEYLCLDTFSLDNSFHDFNDTIKGRNWRVKIFGRY